MNRHQPIERLQGVEYEFRAASLAAERLRVATRNDPTILGNEGLRPAHLEACLRNLHPTYVVRLFAEFEAALRLYWRDNRRRKTWNTIGAEALIQSVGAYRQIPAPIVASAQEVREFRNGLLHQAEARRVSLIPLQDCRSRLCRYLSFLPVRW
jgi:hypothetical protein